MTRSRKHSGARHTLDAALRRLREGGERRPLGRAARVVILAFVAVLAGFELAWQLLGTHTDEPFAALVQIALTVSFGVFAWRPPAGALVLVASASAAVLADVGILGVLALSVAAGVVVATCGVAVIVGYLLAAALVTTVVMLGLPGDEVAQDLTTLTVIAALSAMAGLYLRWMRGREQALAGALADEERAREAATDIERDRIADELHDLIAHELTIIVMHAQVLRRTEDPVAQEVARSAIADAARTALADIRRVLRIASISRDATDDEVDGLRDQLGVSLEDVRAEVHANGGVVRVSPQWDELASGLPSSLDRALGRIVREAATNALKHAGVGATMVVDLTRNPSEVRMRICDRGGGPLRELDLPSGGYGLARMRARAEALGGTFHAGADGDGWTVEVVLPTS